MSGTELKTVEGRIVAAIMEDMRDRRTLKILFGPPGCGSERIDSDIQAEIRRTWRGIIRAELTKERAE